MNPTAKSDPTRRRTAGALTAVAVVTSMLTAVAPAASASSSTPEAGSTRSAPGRWAAAVSHPDRDSMYPEHGSQIVDALHYGLKLSWTSPTLTGTETLTFRAARSASRFSLDLLHALDVTSASLDGQPVTPLHKRDRIRVDQPLARGSRHVLKLTYAGVPHPVAAPTHRGDVPALGFTPMPDGSAWTMQEPFGAYTWYAVNDEPADKAFYDFTVTVPHGMVGVANGRLVSRRDLPSSTLTHWHLDAPASSYLTTLAIGDYKRHVVHGVKGLPIDLWTQRGKPHQVAVLRYAAHAVHFLRRQVGPYPFSTLGIVTVPSNSAMETQTMVTMGIQGGALSKDTVVHEIAHQWYGDTVTPSDWSDVWMNEGMATYLAEGRWSAKHEGISLDQILASWAAVAPEFRQESGPPAAYDPTDFAENNVYLIPALMWDTLRQRLGTHRFDTLIRRWPATHRHASSSRAQLVAWWSKQTHTDLRGFFHRWLLGAQEPPWHAR